MTDSFTSHTSNRSNVVLVHCHDLGQHVGCYGADVETPNLDRIAAEGVRMENSFCTAPHCSPSRSSMMTGAYPHENGLMGLAHMGWELDDDWMTLPKYLQEVGYSTHLLGFQHEVPENPERLGYDHVDTETKRALELVDVVADFFESAAANTANGSGAVDGANSPAATTLDASPDEPFFVSIGLEEPHRPFRREYLPAETYDDPGPEEVSLDDFPYLPDEPGVREDVADLRSLIEGTLDPAIGAYREALAEAGLAEDTLFVFTTDHGLAMPRAKGTCYDPGIETTLLFHQPGVVEGGAVHEDLVSNVDLMPTLLDLLGIDPPTGVAGRSFAPLLRDDEYEPRERIFGEMTWHDRYNPIRAIRTERYKYVRNFSVLPKVFVPMDVAPTPSGRAVLEEFHVEQRPAEELYDLECDPHELENLASDRTPFETADAASGPDPDHIDALDRLREELREWMEATDDPLLDGPVPYPTIE